MGNRTIANIFMLGRLILRPWCRSVLVAGCLYATLPLAPGLAQTASSPLAAVVPGRVVVSQGQEPSWKKGWDAARQLVRSGQAEAAIAAYDKVLRQKPDLEDASWELVQLLLQVGKRARAMSLLETLHENNPEQDQYTLAFARQARPLFEDVLAKEGDSPDVLRGLITVLRQSSDEKEELLNVVQRYQRLKPDDLQTQLLLAKTAFALNRLELARINVTPLAEEAEAAPEVLRLAAKIHDQLGLVNPAIHYWKEVVRKIPQDKEANAVLAAYYAKQPGKEQIALSHYLAIRDQKPLPEEYDYEVGSLYAALGSWPEAIPYLEDYFRRHPDSQKTLRLLISAHAAVGDKKKTLALLERYFASEERPDPKKLRQAADLYDAAGRYHQAIPLYKKLLDLTPNDPELLEVLARDLLLIGEDEGSLQMWQLLSRISPQRLDVHYSMATLLEKLGRDRELVKVLVRLQAMAPDDFSIPLRLAEAYRRLDDRSNCAKVLGSLLAHSFTDSGSLKRRALLSQYLGWYGNALKDFLALLAAGSIDKAEPQDVRLAALECAGKTGQLGMVIKLSADLGDKSSQNYRILAKAYHDAGALWQAESLYLKLLSPDRAHVTAPYLSEAQRKEVLERLAALYGEKNRIFAEEKILRLLAQEKGQERVAFAMLAEQTAQNGQLELANAWLSRAMPDWRHKRMELLLADDPHIFAVVLRAKCALLLSEDREKGAREAVHALLKIITRQPQKIDLDQQARFNLLTSLAWQFSDAGQSKETWALVRAATSYQMTQRQKIIVDVIGARAALKGGNLEKMHKVLEDAASVAEDDSSLRLVYVRILQRARFFKEAAKPAAQLPLLLPDSLAAHLLAASNLRATGRLEKALLEAQRAAEIFPDASEPRWLAMQLLYRQGRFNEALALYASFDAKLQQRPDVLLLRIRSIWSTGRHEESIAAYRSFLEPAAEELYRKEIASTLAPPENDGLTRNKLYSLFGKKEPSLLEQRLAPEAFEPSDSAVAEFAARFHWQQRYRQELSARVSVERFEFYHAARLYKSILEKEQVPDLAMLFDLGGIYSRLERPGEEAAVYEQIAAVDPDYPGLAEAMAQNRLKRRPRAGLYYTFRREEGREDKKSLDRQAAGISSWVSLAPRQEVELQAERIFYRSTLADGQRQWSKRLKATYRTSFLQKLTASLGAGVERLDDIGNNVPLLDCRLEGEMGDAFSWYLALATDLTTDTIESVQQHIRRQSYSLGSALDLLPRLQIGADYLVDSFSDGNITEGYNLWTTYLLLTEPNVLSLRYSYEFLDSRDSSYPQFFLGGVSSNPNHPYYTPHNYWLNNFGLYFKHLLSNEKFGRGIPRYFEVSFSLGHDASGYAVQTLQTGFFSQCNNHFLIRASADITTSETYRSKGAFLSFQYRW
ncbi:MAG: tetratricopeptide repeat protein [Deltaproteobacteria bacterium]